MSILSKVQEIVADSLYIEKEEVTLDSNLMKDLGAESIDFLDIIFRLEQSFGIKIPKGDIEKKARAGLTDDEFAISGVLQVKGVERLREVMPELDHASLKEGMRLRDLPSLYTVSTFVKMVEMHLAEKEKVSSQSKSVSQSPLAVAMQ